MAKSSEEERSRSTRFLPTLAATLAAVLVAVAVVLAAAWLVPPPESVRSRIDKLPDEAALKAQNDFRKSILDTAQIAFTAVTAFGIVATLFFTWRNVRVAETSARKTAEMAVANLEALRDGKITDRFSRAVEQLHNDSVHVRVGAIYALARVAGESEPDYWPIIEILCGFVRERRPCRARAERLRAEARRKLGIDPEAPLPEDVRAIVNVISRRTPVGEGEARRLDLRQTNLDGADFDGAALRHARFDEADLVGTRFNGAQLHDADFTGVNASGAQFASAVLPRAFLSAGNFTGARMTGANLEHARMDNAVFASVIGPVLGVTDDMRKQARVYDVIDPFAPHRP